MSSPTRGSYYSSFSSPRTSSYSSSPRTSSYSSTSTTYSSASPRTSTYSSPRTSSYASPRTSSYASPRTSSCASPRTSTYASPSRIHDISNVGSPTSPVVTKLKQVIRKNHDLKVSARQSMQDKENEVHDIKAKATQSIDDLKEEIALLENRLFNKTHEVKTLQSKLTYAAADHSTAYDLERSLRSNAQANCRALEVKVRKSNEVIRKCKDEIASLKSELAHQTVLSRKYEQRSARLRRKLSEVSANVPTNRDAQEDVERMRAELRESRLNKGGSAYYDMWRSECDNSRTLRKDLAQTQREFEQCDKELVQVQEEFTTLTAASRVNTQRLQKRIINLLRGERGGNILVIDYGEVSPGSRTEAA